MTTEVIILAQGTQQRLGMQHGYKQLLPLPACAHAPILMRTLMQVRSLAPSCQITVVTWHKLHTSIAPTWREPLRDVVFMMLAEPGNSSLKGIARYLERRRDAAPDATMVLLGDVVYSWACLEALVACSRTWGFTGTSDLSSSGGELWGVAWSHRHPSADQHMVATLRDALLRHPPFEDDYQPGQMRRWISGMRRGALEDHVRHLAADGHYFPIGDYTMDVDLPAHVPLLGPASELAAADDARHGLTWPVVL